LGEQPNRPQGGANAEKTSQGVPNLKQERGIGGEILGVQGGERIKKIEQTNQLNGASDRGRKGIGIETSPSARNDAGGATERWNPFYMNYKKKVEAIRGKKKK